MRKTVEIAFVAAMMFGGLVGCNKGVEPASAADAQPSNATSNASTTGSSTTVAADSDPASGNLAPAAQTAQYTQSEPTQVADAQQPQDWDAPVAYQDYPADSGYDTAPSDQDIQTTEPPPPLPDYDQPEIPGDNYYWTPGYWAYGPGGYYWVPGAWVLAPWVDALWTPPYWGFEGGYYRWHSGYWGTHIGFYGGINYGFGYTGRGYYGAYWDHGHLDYNRAAMNVNVTRVHNVYNYSVPAGGGNRVSYNGGRGGITAQPTAQERAVVRDPRTPPVAAQAEHAREASRNRTQFASAGHLAPAALVAAKPLTTTYRAPAEKPPAAAMRAAERVAARPAPQTGRAPEIRQNNQPAPVMRPAPENRPVQENRPAPQAIPDQRRAPDVRQNNQPAPSMRPAPEVRQEPRPDNRPAPVMRPAPQVAPQQQRAPEPRQEMRPAPQAQRAPEVRPAPQPLRAPEVHAAPPQRAPEARPAPQQQRAPEVHAAPPQRAPEARPAPQQQRAPEAHAAPPQRAPEARPNPPERGEKDKK